MENSLQRLENAVVENLKPWLAKGIARYRSSFYDFAYGDSDVKLQLAWNPQEVGIKFLAIPPTVRPELDLDDAGSLDVIRERIVSVVRSAIENQVIVRSDAADLLHKYDAGSVFFEIDRSGGLKVCERPRSMRM
ncbi:hypothetical protein AB0A74_20215 [Saccharothrix sp. NPDC042600]|uniref:hypothetical protein n=1 Tax=Saccharothrix TaxID=2071 RepID=UPI0033DC13BE|nr:hypothetical protein GCM10017745_75230 [Saccharothrix mutabilis subsp. capreolus]